jgi:hypothetical protein
LIDPKINGKARRALTDAARAGEDLTIFNSGGYQVWSSGAWCVMPE